MSEDSLINKIELSHQAIAKTISGLGSDLKKVSDNVIDLNLKMALLADHYGTIVEQNKIRNGRIEKCETKIDEIDWRKYLIGAGGLITVCAGLILWIWDGQANDIKNVDAKVTSHISEPNNIDLIIREAVITGVKQALSQKTNAK